MKNKTKINNLTINKEALYAVACYGAAVLVPFVTMKYIDRDFPFVNNEVKFPKTISIVDVEKADEDAEGFYAYTQTTNTYTIDEGSSYLLDYEKYDVDELEALLGNPDSTFVQVERELPDSEIEYGKTVIIPEYDTNRFSSAKQEKLVKLGELLMYLGLTGFCLLGANELSKKYVK